MSEIAVTIIGMIAAFITASITTFLAEPAKTYFQNRANVHNLRIALYKELFINYTGLRTLVDDADFEKYEAMIKHAIRREGYTYSLQNDISLFYQLEEAHEINVLNMMIGYALALLNDEDGTPEYDLKTACREYVESFEYYVADKRFDEKLLKTLMSESKYMEIVEKRKKVLADEKASETTHEAE
jgi:hypothetical protein